MAHAPAELRDPTAPPGKPPPPGRADDLLSQLAGKEIDRLLADADLDGESGFGAAPPPRPANDRRGDRSTTPAGHDASRNAGPATTQMDAVGGHADEAAEGVAAAEREESPEAADALAGAADTLWKELDQVFDRQLDDAAGRGDRGAARTDAGATATPAAEVRPSAESQADGAVEALGAHGPTAAAKTTAHDAGNASPDATVAAGGPGEAQEPAAAAAADGVGDLLSRLSAGERPPPPDAGSIVAAAGASADPAAHASPDAHAAPEALANPATPGAGHHGHATDGEHASHDATSAAAAAATHAAIAANPSADPHHAAGDNHGSAAPAAGGAAHADVVHLPAGEPGPSLADKVLAVLAIPLDPFPDEARDAVGKLAIITAVNGVAVLVYVMFFRG